MSAKHTPGPWRAHKYGVRDVGGYIFALNWPQRYDGQQARFEKETAEREGDARLIAACVIPCDLYASEINFEIATFWDGGFDVKLGDALNGYKAEDCCDSYVLALEQLRDWAITHFPESEFAKKYSPKAAT